MIHTPQAGSAVSSRLDDLHLSKRERLRVDAYMHDGERIADLICSTQAHIQSGANRLAHALKVIFASTARH